MNNTTNSSPAEVGRNFTLRELIVWYNPKTWPIFRRELIERPSQEMTPELRGNIDSIVLLELPYLKRQLGENKMTQIQYDGAIASLRKRLGNVLYY